MSQLQKKINNMGRREGGVGFNRATQEKPRAMLLGAMVASAADAKKSLEAGADVVILHAANASDAAKAIADAAAAKAALGALVPSLDDAGAEALRKAGCDFVISPLESTSSTAVDTDKMGHVVALPDEIGDSTLRALGPLGLDGLYVEHLDGALTLSSVLCMRASGSRTARYVEVRPAKPEPPPLQPPMPPWQRPFRAPRG